VVNSGAWSNMLAPLRQRDFRLVWSGNLVSRLGDGVFTVAVALEALRVDHAPTGLAYVLAGQSRTWRGAVDRDARHHATRR